MPYMAIPKPKRPKSTIDLVFIIKSNEIGETYKDETKKYPCDNQHDKIEYIGGEE